MINNNMLYGIGDLVLGNVVTIPSYMTLGSTTGNISSGDTITSGEFKRTALTSKTRSGNLIKFETLFTGTLTTAAPINVVGLMNSSAGGDLWANMLMASIMQSTSYDIDIELWVQFTGV
jgi:hypothetical protein